MIKIRPNIDNFRKELWINEKLIGDNQDVLQLFSLEAIHKNFRIIVNDSSLRDLILSLKFSDLNQSNIAKLEFYYDKGELNIFEGLPRLSERKKKGKDVVRVDLFGRVPSKSKSENDVLFWFYDKCKLDGWEKLYSYSSYVIKRQEEINQLVSQKELDEKIKLITDNGSYVAIKYNPSDETLIEVFTDLSNLINSAHLLAIEKLENEIRIDSISQVFNFPPSVRVVCEQYLQYFVDFLRDVGVSAIANIEHDKAGKTLFSVKTDNSKIALEAIREALAIYLELPMNPLVDESEMSDSRMLALKAEIHTLNARLNFAQIRQIELEQRSSLQKELIEAQKEILHGKNNQILTLQRYEPRHFEPSIVYESAIETNYVDAEIVEETNGEKLTETSNKEIDLGLVTVKPAKIGLGVEANTPRLTRLGIKKGKELFDYLDKKFNSEEK